MEAVSGIHAPDGVKDPVAGQDDPRVAHEVFQELELEGGRLDDPIAPTNLVRADVQHEIREAEDLAVGRRAPPQQRPYAREQLVVGERLHEVVVGAAVETADPVVDRVARGQHENRHIVRRRAQSPADLDAVESGQHEVQHDEVRQSLAARRRAAAGPSEATTTSWPSYVRARRTDAARRGSSSTTRMRARSTIASMIAGPTKRWMRSGSVPAAREDPHHLFDVAGVVAIGPLVEVASEGGDRLAEPPHPAKQEAAIAAVLGIGGLDDREELDRPERRRPVASREVRGSKVPENASEGFALARWPEHPRVEQDAVTNRAPDQRLAVVRGETATVTGRVDEEAAWRPDDVVPGQPDTGQRQSDSPGDLELHDREADRQADPTPGDQIEEAVARVVELGGRRRAEPGLAEEDVVETIEDMGLGVSDIEPDPDTFGECVKDRERWRGVDIRPPVGGDQQGSEAEVDLGFRLGDQPGEAGPVGGA